MNVILFRSIALWLEKLKTRGEVGRGNVGGRGVEAGPFYECRDYSEAQSRSHTLGLLAQRAGVFSLCRKISRLRVL